MLLDYIVNFCDIEYRNANTDNICGGCTHPEKCSGSCETCLDEVHFPNDHPEGKKEYDCKNMLNYYVCRYSHKYCSEIEYALESLENLNKLEEFNVMSIGCGPSPDLMALEFYIQKNNMNIPIKYSGYDKNELWKPTHREIKKYGKNNGIEANYKYVDVVKYFNQYYITNEINLVFLQYVISYFYNTGQITEINTFFYDLVDSIITKRAAKQDFTIIINDVNSNRRGRDYFEVLIEKLIENDLHGSVRKQYFDYCIKNEYQRYGDPYYSYSNLHKISDGIKKYNPAIYCSSAQLIIEVNGAK